VTDHIILQVTRYRPERELEPTTQEYKIPLHEEWSVLDGLNHIKDQLDGTLSYRWSCRMGICGSCGMTVNGEPRLTCATFLDEYRPGPIRIEPLRNFPVIRDLVVEIGDFMRKLPEVKPWLIRDDDAATPGGELLQTPAEMDDYRQYSMCINCMLCYSACPIVGLEEGFLGPAAMPWRSAAAWITRPGQPRTPERLSTDEGVWPAR
jgi:fumarate reductase iron-sulfur subunit